MLKGINDSPAEARELVRLLEGIPAKVNLIPFNPWPGAPYECSTDEAIKAFSDIVFAAGYSAPVRTPRGRDIFAACGQLKSASVRARRSEPAPASAAVRGRSRDSAALSWRRRAARADLRFSDPRSSLMVAVLGGLYFFQRQLLYFPDRSPPQLGDLAAARRPRGAADDRRRPVAARLVPAAARRAGRSSPIFTAMAAISATAPSGCGALPAKATAC